ncbi:DUF3618 domain-containing protein [Streptomyces sp. NPDC050856]|uniref:DUF3618 domain-containing protein n=1 Tax=unclassified Streptomyces TaxID=2593676 RepID=UPI0033C192D5
MTPETPGKPGPDELRREAARKRQELGDTIDQLMAKTDVKRRAAQAVHDRTPEAVRDTALQAVETGRRHQGPVIAALVAVVVAGIVVRQLRRRGKWG